MSHRQIASWPLVVLLLFEVACYTDPPDLVTGTTARLRGNGASGSGYVHVYFDWKLHTATTWTQTPGANVAPNVDCKGAVGCWRETIETTPGAVYDYQFCGQPTDSNYTPTSQAPVCGATVTFKAEMMYGLNDHMHRPHAELYPAGTTWGAQEVNSLSSVDTECQTLANMHAGIARTDVLWNTLEDGGSALPYADPSAYPHVPDSVQMSGLGYVPFDLLDEAVNKCSSLGVKLLLTVLCAPSRANSAPSNCNNLPSVDVRALGSFAHTLAIRYNGKIAGLEIWNEPAGYGPQAYANAIIAVWNAIQSDADPNVKATRVVAGVTSNPWAGGQSFYTAVANTYGARGHYTDWSYHEYIGTYHEATSSMGGRYVMDANAMRTVLNNNGESDVGLWMTEYGFPYYSPGGGPNGTGDTQQTQNDYYGSVLTAMRANGVLSAIIGYDLRSMADGVSDPFAYYGVYSQAGGFPGDPTGVWSPNTAATSVLPFLFAGFHY